MLVLMPLVVIARVNPIVAVAYALVAVPLVVTLFVRRPGPPR